MKFDERRNVFKKAVDKLDEVLKLKESEIIRDSSIKRFEFCFELCWKTISDFLKEKGLTCRSPKDAFQSAFSYGLIKDDPLWLEMIEDKNLTVHTYQEALSEEIYRKLPDYLLLFREILNLI